MNEDANLLGNIVGEQLSSVEFVQDYVQLHFDGPTLTAFVWPVVSSTRRTLRFGDEGYRDELCLRIGHKVRATHVRADEAVRVDFEDGSTISISLRAEDRVGPEAGHFRRGEGPTDPILEF